VTGKPVLTKILNIVARKRIPRKYWLRILDPTANIFLKNTLDFSIIFGKLNILSYKTFWR